MHGKTDKRLFVLNYQTNRYIIKNVVHIVLLDKPIW